MTSRAPHVLAIALVAAGAAAAASVVVSNSTLDVGVIAPSVHFEKGASSENSRWFKHVILSANKTVVDIDAKPKVGAGTFVQDVLRVVNERPGSRSVTLSASPVQNTNVRSFSWVVKDGVTTVARLDYKTATPTATFTLPASATYRLDLEVDVVEGAGKNNAKATFDLRLGVTG